MSRAWRIVGGRVIDPVNGWDEPLDLLVEEGRVAAVEKPGAAPAGGQEIDATGLLVLPGLVDPHVHLAGGPEGFAMLARAGVTTALDMMGEAETLFPLARRARTGLTMGFLRGLIPGRTLSSSSASGQEVERAASDALASGAFGVKLIGGHYPVAPDVIARGIEAASELGGYCAAHVGSTETGSDLDGLREVLVLAGSRPLHVAHVNSYCRGRIADPLVEAAEALRLLEEAPRAQSESYLALINGCSGTLGEDGRPRSRVTRTQLAAAGYADDREGLERAVREGAARVNGQKGDEIVLLSPGEGWTLFQERDGRVTLSFNANSASAAIALALARGRGRRFVVDALSTDGGGIPRNTTLVQGLALADFGAWSLSDFVAKACAAPARMLGLESKGHLRPGMDADLVLVDPLRKTPVMVFCGGELVCREGVLSGRVPCRLFGHPSGGGALEASGLAFSLQRGLQGASHD